MLKNKMKKETEITEEKPKKVKKKMSKKKKVIIGVIAAVVVLAIIGSSLLGGGSTAYPVTVGAVEIMDIEQNVSIKGIIQGSEKADVASANNFKVTQILVKEGDRVKSGQLLATLDGGELQENYKKAQLALSESKRQLSAAETLYGEGAMSKDDYMKAKAAYESDSLNVSSFDGLDAVNIKSPIDGTVTRVNVNIGRYASDTEDKQPMFVVENLDKLQMKVKVSEYDIAKIKVGQTVDISAEVLGEGTVKGTVARISPSGEQKDASTTEMVIPVLIDVEKADTNLIAGVTAKATILIDKKEKAMSVPVDGILEDPATGETYIFTVSNSVIKKVPVTLGLEGNFNLEITAEGVKAGDQIVLGPTFDLTDGMTVTVTNPMDGAQGGGAAATPAQ